MLINPMWPEIHSIPVAEHPFLWIARKSHKTHFATSKNRSCSLPKTTNTPLLYDGTTEAKLILMGILRDYSPQEGLAFEEELTVEGMGVLNHALNYVKGITVDNLGMWSLMATSEVDNCQICHGEEGGVLGNENVINGVIVCDYCTAEELNPVVKYLEEGPAPTIYFEESTGALVPTDELIQITPKEDENVEDKQPDSRHFPEGD